MIIKVTTMLALLFLITVNFAEPGTALNFTKPANTVNLTEIENAFFEKCRANSTEENVKQIQRELSAIEDDLRDMWDIYEEDKLEMTYCPVSNKIKTSVYNITNYAKDCLPSEDVLNEVMNVVDDVFCNRPLYDPTETFYLLFHIPMALLVQHYRSNYFDNSKETVRVCSKASFGIDFNSSADYVKTLYLFMIENKCAVMDDFWSCIRNDIRNSGNALKPLWYSLYLIRYASKCKKPMRRGKRDIADDERNLYNFFRSRCNSDEYERFLRGVNSLSFCFQTGYQRAHAAADPKEFCKQEERLLKECYYNGVDEMLACFRREEKFLGDFLKKSLKNMLHFVCGDDARHLKEYFSDSGKACSKKIVDASNKDDGELEHCLDRIFSPSGAVVTERELCRDLSVAEECTFRYINKTCPENKMYQTLGRGFIHSLQAPCGSGCAVCWNLFIFVLISIVVTKFL